MKPTKDILEIARVVPIKPGRGGGSSIEEIASNHDLARLALAWIKGEVTLSQMCKALGRNHNFTGGSTAYAVCSRLRTEVIQGRIKLK